MNSHSFTDHSLFIWNGKNIWFILDNFLVIYMIMIIEKSSQWIMNQFFSLPTMFYFIQVSDCFVVKRHEHLFQRFLTHEIFSEIFERGLLEPNY